MEWTIDAEGFDENPLITPAGRAEIRSLQQRHSVAVRSLTADSFMQAPFFKVDGAEAMRRLEALRRLVEAAAELGLGCIVIPLVDNGRIETASQAGRLREGLENLALDCGPKLIFESDLPPAELAGFIADYPSARFGINYDTGNSASLGFDPSAEIAAYGGRIDNVHIKDRLLGGTTVPLGAGAANLPLALQCLQSIGYAGDFILQTARAGDDDHAGVLSAYRASLRGWLGEEI